MPESADEHEQSALRRSIDKARATGDSAKRSLLNPTGFRGVAEAAWLATHVAMYPFGLVEDKYRHAEERHNLDGLPPSSAG